MNWYNLIKKYHGLGYWTDSMVGEAVIAGKITPEQYQEITGKEYTI